MKPEPASPTKPRKRILIVEDDAEFREVLICLLDQAGYEVIGAEHALAAVFAAVRAAPELILMDVRMPIMNGLELVRELKSHLDTCAIRVVAMTGYDGPEARAAALAAGCDGFLAKPIEPKSLLAQIRGWLG